LNCFFLFSFFLLVSVAAEFKKLGVGLDMNLDWISGLVLDFPFECIMGFTLLLLLLLLVLLFFMMFIVAEYNKSGIVLLFLFFFGPLVIFRVSQENEKKRKEIEIEIDMKIILSFYFLPWCVINRKKRYFPWFRLCPRSSKNGPLCHHHHFKPNYSIQ